MLYVPAVTRYSVGQKFGKHIDDSVEVAPGQVTGYTLLVYLSGTPQQGPIDFTGSPAASGSGAQANGSSGSSSKSKRQKQGSAGATAGSSLPVQINTNALQEVVGGETVFYGEEAGRTTVGLLFDQVFVTLLC